MAPLDAGNIASSSSTSAGATTLLSPAELSYLHTSLSHPASHGGPLRPDGRAATQFRPLIAETDVLPGTNGSARVCFADGTEAVVGVKAEVERTPRPGAGVDDTAEVAEGEVLGGKAEWVVLGIEIPGFREDDALPVFLGRMLGEGVVCGGAGGGAGDVATGVSSSRGGMLGRLRINEKWHWKVYIDVLLLSPPLSYPLPLLSLTTHLALLSTRLPRLKSEGDEDPLFDDDWEAAEFLYPSHHSETDGKKTAKGIVAGLRPPVTLLVMSVGNNVVFDPSREELAVADCVLAVSVLQDHDASSPSPTKSSDRDDDGSSGALRVVSVRTIDPPSRMTAPGVPLTTTTSTSTSEPGPGAGAAAGAGAPTTAPPSGKQLDNSAGKGIWRPPRGGVQRATLSRMVEMVVGDDFGEKSWGRAVAREVLDGLEGFVAR